MNLFIGFPVARAKIADMISTSAPPTLHHTQHEAGGTDVVSVSGVPTINFENDIYIADSFQSKNCFNQTVTGSSTITEADTGIKLTSGTTVGNLARVYKRSIAQQGPPTWSKNRTLITALQVSTVAGTGTKMLLRSGWNATNARHIGFSLKDNRLYGTCGNGSAESTVDLVGADYGTQVVTSVLKAVFTTGSKVEFYMDNVLKGTLTTNLPEGSSDAEYIFNLLAQCATAADVIEARPEWFMFTQKA